MKAIVMYAAVLLLTCEAYGAAPTDGGAESIGPVTIYNTDQYPLRSEKIGQDYLVQVHYPQGYQQSKKNYPVIYLLDPETLFRGLVDDLTLFVQSGLYPASIIVGIAYDQRKIPQLDRPVNYSRMRNRDLTPTRDADFLPTQKSIIKRYGESGNQTGGAGDFLAFINEQVKPFINSRYRVDQDNETLVGYSFGGLFALYALFSKPESFDNFIVGSPSIWWDHGMIFSLEEKLSSASPNLPKQVFISAGALEQGAMGTYVIDMADDVRKLREKLSSRNYPGLRVEHVILDNETHVSVSTVFISRGLRFLAEHQSGR
jgi:predicted alpha/beta superfamily hydrolase